MERGLWRGGGHRRHEALRGHLFLLEELMVLQHPYQSTRQVPINDA